MTDKDKIAILAALLLPGVQRSDPRARADAAVEQANHLIDAVENHFSKAAGELAAAQQKIDDLKSRSHA